MTLGLATCDKNGIYVAIESEGLQHLNNPKFSKRLKLNVEPQIIVLAAGGLEHWVYVMENYTNTSSVSDATFEIIRLLNLCMKSQNQAFGLVCGYEKGRPKCYRINRQLNCQTTDQPIEESLSDIQVLGLYAKEAKIRAIQATQGKMDILEALEETIDSFFSKVCIKPPISKYVIRPNGS